MTGSTRRPYGASRRTRPSGLAAGWIAEQSRGRSPFRIALTGGSTPRVVYERLAEMELDWPSWHVWWSDEREVPPDHPDSNERLAREALLSRVEIPGEPDPSAALARRSAPGGLRPRAPRRRLTTATRPRSTPATTRSSPIPARSSTSRCRAWSRCTPGSRSRSPYLNAQPLVALIVGGEDKREILARILAGDESLTAARVQRRGDGRPHRRGERPSNTCYLGGVRRSERADSISSPTASTSASSPGRAAIWRDAGSPSSAGPQGGRAPASRGR